MSWSGKKLSHRSKERYNIIRCLRNSEESLARHKEFVHIGVYKGRQQVGFARAISDYATFAYIGDVFILEDYRGLGLSKWLMQTIVEHPALQGLRRWMLITRDAHGLYSRVGFTATATPERYMERVFGDVYKSSSGLR